MSKINKNITIETENIKEGKETIIDIPSQNIKLELENHFLTFKDNMNESFNRLKDEILRMVTELRETVFTLSTKVSVISKEVDMIKIVGSTAIGIMITGFSFLYTQMNTKIDIVRVEMKAEMNQIRQEMNTKFDKIDEKFDKIDEKFDKIDEKFEKLYYLITNKK